MEETRVVNSNVELNRTKSLTMNSELHTTYDEWVLYAHYSHVKEWNLDSYTRIHNINTLEDMICLNKYLPKELITNCMLFIMRQDIKPIWEDKENKNGGCFSYKVPNHLAENTWKTLSYFLISENISSDIEFMSKVNGMTISPKKHFCILKLWLKDCSYETNEKIDCFISDEFSKLNCIFKKHV